MQVLSIEKHSDALVIKYAVVIMLLLSVYKSIFYIVESCKKTIIKYTCNKVNTGVMMVK